MESLVRGNCGRVWGTVQDTDMDMDMDTYQYLWSQSTFLKVDCDRIFVSQLATSVYYSGYGI